MKPSMMIPLCAALIGLFALFGRQSVAAVPPPLVLYAGKPIDGATILFGDFDVQRPLLAEHGRVDDDPKLAHAVVDVSRSREGALKLAWKDAWFATVRVQTQPLDLRPYLNGTVSFDLKVNELADGGLAFRLDCGRDCERKVNYVVRARAAQGTGWQHLRYRLTCFYRDGDDFSAVTQPFALDGTGAGDVEIANVQIDDGGTANAACPDYRTVSVTPAPLEESWSLAWWLPRHAEKLAEIARRAAAGESTELVFIGDSITHNWEKEYGALWEAMWGRYHPLNLGYGGDRTENVLWRLQHGEIDGVHPRLIVLMIGTNNTGLRHDAPTTTYAGIALTVAALRARQPNATILLLAIFPRGADPSDPARRANEAVNALLPQLADGKQVMYRNINSAFLAPDGTLSPAIFPDLLHPNEAGYVLWQRAIQADVVRLMR